MRTLVLGGTGHLGSAFVREAALRGDEVIVATRQVRPVRSLVDLNVRQVALRSDDRLGLRTLVRDADLVVDAAAPYPLYRGDISIDDATQRMRMIVRETAASGAKLLYIGSFVSNIEAHTLKSTLSRVVHPYYAIKQAMQQAVLEACQHGMKASIVCPVACLGPGDPKPPELSVVGLLLQHRIPATLDLPTSVIDVRDVARLGLSAVDAGYFGTPLTLVGHALSTEELAARICELAGIRAPSIQASASLAWGSAVIGEVGSRMLGLRPKYAPLSILLMCESYPRLASAQQQALAQTLRPLDETLRDAIAWVRSQSPS